MVIYKVTYVNLTAPSEYQEAVAKSLQFNHISGLQRALIALEPVSSQKKLDKAYSVVAYFHANNLMPGEIQFLREENKHWDDEEVREKIRRSASRIEILADVNPDLTVEVKQNSFEPEKKVLQLERYLMQFGAFARATDKRTKILDKSKKREE